MSFDLSPVASEVILFLAALILLLVAAIIVLGQDKTRVIAMGGHFVFDGYAAFLKFIIDIGAAVAVAMAGGYMRDQKIDRFEYPLLGLFSALGMSMMVSANSLL